MSGAGASIEVRGASAADLGGVERVYREAFPHEDLIGLLRELLADPENGRSFVASSGDEIVGHVFFTACGLDGSTRAGLWLLGPLCVLRALQRQGVGGALLRHGFERLEAEGAERVCVLGDPGYYRRFGFEREAALRPPYSLPAAWAEAWRSRPLGAAGPAPAGLLTVPEPWMRPNLWSE